MKVHQHIFPSVASPEHLFRAWEEFRKGKQARPDVQAFAWNLEENIFQLSRDLLDGSYHHGPYSAFMIQDPKQRQIHKATVRDRIVHHAVFAALNPIFEPGFIVHSFSCRRGKGTHKGVDTLERMLRSASRNHTDRCFALKCDIHRFFASVDHGILLALLAQRIEDRAMMELLSLIIEGFCVTHGNGIPIGNLTSQLFANVSLHELDHFIKHTLRIKPYIRYTDDFVIVDRDEHLLRSLLIPIEDFLQQRLSLSLHPHKVTIHKYRQGIDFLGYVLLPHYRRLRTKTKRRIFRSAQRNGTPQSLQSHLGVLSHANTYRLSQKLRNHFWLWMGRAHGICILAASRHFCDRGLPGVSFKNSPFV